MLELKVALSICKKDSRPLLDLLSVSKGQQ